MSTARFERAIAAIDAANAADPNTVTVRGRTGRKELLHAELVTEWVRRLRPEASEALLLAARAHHVERWTIPRSTHPEGRAGYLRWRRALHDLHAARSSEILRACGYDTATVERVADLVCKRGLARHDRDTQTLEDALCLVFVETQLDALAARLEPDRLRSVLDKTLRKMSAPAVALAAELHPALRPGSAQ
jgi:hypothetical protein